MFALHLVRDKKKRTMVAPTQWTLGALLINCLPMFLYMVFQQLLHRKYIKLYNKR